MIVGWYWDTNYYGHGFVFKHGLNFVSYSYSGSCQTEFGGVNNRGLICGNYGDASGNNHGFIAKIR